MSGRYVYYELTYTDTKRTLHWNMLYKMLKIVLGTCVPVCRKTSGDKYTIDGDNRSYHIYNMIRFNMNET